MRDSENIIWPVKPVLLAIMLKGKSMFREQRPKVVSDISLSEEQQYIYSHSLKLN